MKEQAMAGVAKQSGLGVFIAGVRAAVVIGVAASALLLASCGGQRPLHVVLKDGNHALKTGDAETAVADFSEYVERKPDLIEARYGLARALMAAGRPREAVEHLIFVLDVDPLNDAYADSLAEAMYASNERDALTAFLARYASERGRVTDFTRQGVYAQKLGNLDEAQQALKTAAKLDQGRTAGVQRNLADFYGSLGDRDRQVERLRMAYWIDSNDAGLVESIRAAGEIPGPTFGMQPTEWVAPAPR
jgi:tetratricopeptide (TPR) repeat protein